MKILFLAQRYSYFRNFDSVVRELSRRGHEIHLAVEQDHEQGLPLVRTLAAECAGVSFGMAAPRADESWSWVVERVRFGLEYLRYQHRLFDDTPMLRERSRERTPGVFVAVGDAISRYARWTRKPVTACLRWLERAVPEDAAIHEFLEQQQPDVVLITPLIALGSSQFDYLRAAKLRRIPIALCVWSWDHLSSKALIRELPDRVFVWNDTQKREAVDLHGVPQDRVVVTGAQCFDRWFDRAPSRRRTEFCRDAGVPDREPLLLYVCSAPFAGSPPEAPFVIEWVRRVRAAASPRLRSAPILVRPHPSRRTEWEQVDSRGLEDVAIWGGDPVDARGRADYFDSLYYSTVVVGLNTSAFIEAGILGRPVFTLLLPEWHENQQGTVHFRYLLDASGGLLHAAQSFDEHLRQLDGALVNPRSEVRPFVTAFVRPHGLDVPATPLFANEVEALRAVRPEAPARAPLAPVARWLLRRAAVRRDDVRTERWLYSSRELEAIVRNRAARQVKADRDAAIKRDKAARKAMRVSARRMERDRYRDEKRRLSS